MAGELFVSNLTGSFDYNDLLQKTQELKSQQVTVLQQKEALLYQKDAALSSFATTMKTFQEKFVALTDPALFDKKSATVSNESAFTATITDHAAVSATDMDISVTQLAQNDVWLSLGGVADKNSGAVATVSGTLNISYAGNTVATIDYDTNDLDATHPSSLQEIADAINGAQESVAASVFYDGSNYRLLLSGKDTGSANTIGLTDSGDLLSRLQMGSSYAASHAATAQNAKITIYGQEIQSPTNTFDSFLKGVSLTVLKAGQSAKLTIAQDDEPFTKALSDFVDQYNAIVDFIGTNTAAGGVLSGDFTLKQIKSQIFASFTPLFEAGVLDVDRTSGHLSIDSNELNSQLQSNRDTFKTKITVLQTNLKDYLDVVLDSNGVIDSKKRSIDRQISNVKESIDLTSRRINEEIETLRQQFINLQKFLAQMEDVRSRISAFGANSSPKA